MLSSIIRLVPRLAKMQQDVSGIFRSIFSNTALEWSEKWSERWSGLSKSEQQVLLLMLVEPQISRSKLSKLLGINPSAIQKHIEKLKAKHIIKHIGPDKGGHWEVIEND